jgi:hypothetical protein
MAAALTSDLLSKGSSPMKRLISTPAIGQPAVADKGEKRDKVKETTLKGVSKVCEVIFLSLQLKAT